MLTWRVFHPRFHGSLFIFFSSTSAEMSCLMETLQDKRVRLQPECKKRLQDRIDMWSYAAKVAFLLASACAAATLL